MHKWYTVTQNLKNISKIYTDENSHSCRFYISFSITFEGDFFPHLICFNTLFISAQVA